MSLRIRAGILQRDSTYLGNQSKLDTKVFEVEKMDNIIYAWLTPAADSGVGSPTSIMSVQEAQFAPSTTSLRGIDFDYNHSDSVRKHYFISADSADFLAAQGGAGSTNVNGLTTLSVISPNGGNTYSILA